MGTENYRISNNIAICGAKYSGDVEPYVSVAVTLDGNAVDVSAKNDFEVAE